MRPHRMYLGHTGIPISMLTQAQCILYRYMEPYPKGPCTQIVYTLGPTYLYREYFKAKVYTIWVHGPLGLGLASIDILRTLRLNGLRD